MAGLLQNTKVSSRARSQRIEHRVDCKQFTFKGRLEGKLVVKERGCSSVHQNNNPCCCWRDLGRPYFAIHFATCLRLSTFYIPCPSMQAIQHPNGRPSLATSLSAATTAAGGDIASSSDVTDALFGEQQEPAVSGRAKAYHCGFRVARRATHEGVCLKCRHLFSGAVCLGLYMKARRHSQAKALLTVAFWAAV